MSQHDMDVANQGFAAFRSDLNTALQALASQQSGASAPSTTYAYQLWADTTNGLLKQRNAANSGWIIRGTLDETLILSRSSNTMLDVSDRGKTVIATASFTQTFDAVATLADGWSIDYLINSGVSIVFDPNSSETFDGATTKTIAGPAALRIVCNGSNLVSSARSLSLGAHTIWMPAGAMTSRTTSGAAPGTTETTTNKVMLKTLDFDAATAEYAQFTVRMPKSWDEGTVTAYFLWLNASGTGNVVWGLQGVAISDDDVLDAAFGTAQTVTDGVTAAGDLMQSAETSAITIAGTPAANDLVVFQVYRDAPNGSDTLAVDARLWGVVIVYTVDAGNDA